LSTLIIIPPEELRAMLREVVREELDARTAEAPPINGAMGYRSGTLSVAEAAQMAHRNPETIRRAIHDSTLRATKPEGGREWLIESNELRRWMKAAGPKRSPRALDMKSEVESAVARALEPG
jgi:excisionase family DNA binding protein